MAYSYKKLWKLLIDKNMNKVALRDAVKRLVQLDALEPESENITELGKVLSSIPLNPSNF